MKFINAERHQTALHSSKCPLTAYDCATGIVSQSILSSGKKLGNQLCSWDFLCLELNFSATLRIGNTGFPSTEIEKTNSVFNTIIQTWNLSKILHTQIFRLKVLHRKSA